MAAMKKRTITIFACGAVLTLLSCMAFIDNVSVVARWRRAFIAANGDASRMRGDIPGLIQAFDWAAVDYSCVSTFIPFFGFLLFTLATLRALRRGSVDHESFPFFKSYDQVNVSLGLVGTLWGIIMIGYYDMDTVTMADLMACLHTALFSTLVAVVWVFLVVRPVLVPLSGVVLAECGIASIDEDDRSLNEALDALRAAASGVGALMDGQRKAVEDFTESLGKAAGAYGAAAIAATGHEKALAESLAATLAKMEASADAAASSAADAARAAVAAVEDARKASVKAIADSFEERLKAMDAADMDRRRKFAEALSARLKQFDEAQSVREKLADEAQAARERRFDEIFDRRLRKLEGESRANAERADRAESALDRIKAALG